MNKCECENSAESIISEYFYQHFKKNPDHQFKIELINLIEQKKMEIWDATLSIIRMQLEDYAQCINLHMMRLPSISKVNT